LESNGANSKETDTFWIVKGTNVKLTPPKGDIDVGNSGTTLYLAAVAVC
jgi:5-enolpyruvylshikimate-3-phosphate synthase